MFPKTGESYNTFKELKQLALKQSRRTVSRAAQESLRVVCGGRPPPPPSLWLGGPTPPTRLSGAALAVGEVMMHPTTVSPADTIKVCGATGSVLTCHNELLQFSPTDL